MFLIASQICLLSLLLTRYIKILIILIYLLRIFHYRNIVNKYFRYPNVLILTTSNLKNAIDMAFVDRADIQIYVGPPSIQAIYQIFVSCIEELIRVRFKILKLFYIA